MEGAFVGQGAFVGGDIPTGKMKGVVRVEAGEAPKSVFCPVGIGINQDLAPFKEGVTAFFKVVEHKKPIIRIHIRKMGSGVRSRIPIF